MSIPGLTYGGMGANDGSSTVGVFEGGRCLVTIDPVHITSPIIRAFGWYDGPVPVTLRVKFTNVVSFGQPDFSAPSTIISTFQITSGGGFFFDTEFIPPFIGSLIMTLQLGSGTGTVRNPGFLFLSD